VNSPLSNGQFGGPQSTLPDFDNTNSFQIPGSNGIFAGNQQETVNNGLIRSRTMERQTQQSNTMRTDDNARPIFSDQSGTQSGYSEVNDMSDQDLRTKVQHETFHKNTDYNGSINQEDQSSLVDANAQLFQPSVQQLSRSPPSQTEWVPPQHSLPLNGPGNEFQNTRYQLPTNRMVETSEYGNTKQSSTATDEQLSQTISSPRLSQNVPSANDFQQQNSYSRSSLQNLPSQAEYSSPYSMSSTNGSDRNQPLLTEHPEFPRYENNVENDEPLKTVPQPQWSSLSSPLPGNAQQIVQQRPSNPIQPYSSSQEVRKLNNQLYRPQPDSSSIYPTLNSPSRNQALPTLQPFTSLNSPANIVTVPVKNALQEQSVTTNSVLDSRTDRNSVNDDIPKTPLYDDRRNTDANNNPQFDSTNFPSLNVDKQNVPNLSTNKSPPSVSENSNLPNEIANRIGKLDEIPEMSNRLNDRPLPLENLELYRSDNVPPYDWLYNVNAENPKNTKEDEANKLRANPDDIQTHSLTQLTSFSNNDGLNNVDLPNSTTEWSYIVQSNNDRIQLPNSGKYSSNSLLNNYQNPTRTLNNYDRQLDTNSVIDPTNPNSWSSRDDYYSKKLRSDIGYESNSPTNWPFSNDMFLQNAMAIMPNNVQSLLQMIQPLHEVTRAYFLNSTATQQTRLVHAVIQSVIAGLQNLFSPIMNGLFVSCPRNF